MPSDEEANQNKQRELYKQDTPQGLLYSLAIYTSFMFQLLEKPSQQLQQTLERVKGALGLASQTLRDKLIKETPINGEYYHKDSCTRVFPVWKNAQFVGFEVWSAVPSNSEALYKASLTPEGDIVETQKIGTYQSLDDALSDMREI